jgi:hypothetical protein
MEFFQGRARVIDLPVKVDSRGSLIPFDFAQLPFPPRHAFTVQGVPAGMTRGRHALNSSITAESILLVLASAPYDPENYMEEPPN